MDLNKELEEYPLQTEHDLKEELEMKNKQQSLWGKVILMLTFTL